MLKNKALFILTALLSISVFASYHSNKFVIGTYKGESAIIMNGEYVDKNTSKSFDEILMSNPSIKTVVLGDSLGGKSYAAMRIGALIRINNIKTVVVGSCDSACALIWLGGVERTIEEGGVLGYHPSTSYLDKFALFPTFGESTQRAREMDQKYFKVMGIPKNHKKAYDDGWFGYTSKVSTVDTSNEDCKNIESNQTDSSSITFKCVN